MRSSWSRASRRTWRARDCRRSRPPRSTMTQIAGALISIVLVLVAVFLPVAFLGGVTGKLYQQFAVTIAISMVISGVMALTLSPALAAHHHQGASRREEGLLPLVRERLRAPAQRLRGRRRARDPGVARRAHRVRLHHRRHRADVPHRCRRVSCPTRTRAISSPPSWRPTRPTSRSSPALTKRAQEITSADPAVQDVASVAGYSLIDGQIQNNGAVLFASLKPFEERKDASHAVVRGARSA